MPAPSPWWDPGVHADRRPLLLARNRLQAALRGHFESRDFVEVETAILQVSPGNETHLHAFATDLVPEAGGAARRLYLHTSPEFACKKLLAAGEPRLFQFARAFRNRERSALHHPEFTMLEWYRAQLPYGTLIDDCKDILAIAAQIGEIKQFTLRDRTAIAGTAEIVTVADAFDRFAGIDLLATLTATETDRDGLAAAAQAAGIRTAADDTWSDLFSRVLVEKIEPQLGRGRPTFLTEYPVPEAALARPSPKDPRVAERFELFVCGVELANAFGELTDAGEQRRRFEAAMHEKKRLYGEAYPVDPDFLAAVAAMPPSCGCALGFDRLVMLMTGAPRIEQVMWTPVAEAGA